MPTARDEMTMSTARADDLVEGTARLLASKTDVILNAVDQGIYCLDGQGHTIFANEAAVRMLGFTLREMLGRPQHELIHHHYADGSPFPVEACPIWTSVTDGVHQRVGGDTFWRKDGTPLPVDYTSTPIREGRAIIAVVVTFRDMTVEQEARRQVERLATERAAREEAERGERALQERDERFRAVIAATGQIVWTNSPDGRMTGEQPGWAAYTGQSPEEYAGFGWADALHPDDAGPTVEAWNDAVARRSTFVFEHRVRGRDGEYRYFAVRAIPLLDERGEIREWVGSHLDITEQRRARDAASRALAEAQHARSELQRVFEQAPAAIATLEGESLTFRTANRRFQDLVGGRELIGKPVREALPDFEGQPFFDLLEQVYRTGRTYEGRQMQALVDRTGSGKLEPRVFDFVYQPLTNSDGVVTGVLIHAVEVAGA